MCCVDRGGRGHSSLALRANSGQVWCPLPLYGLATAAPNVSIERTITWSHASICKLVNAASQLVEGTQRLCHGSCCLVVLTPNSHQVHLRIRTPRSLCTKNRYHTCKRQNKWAVSSCVHIECVCTTTIADGFQPQTCAGAWCGMS